MTGLERPARPLLTQAALLLAAVVFGLASRIYRAELPRLIALYGGDTLWATALFLALGLLRPRASTGTLAATTAVLSLLVEMSQLAHPPWLDRLRQVPGVALVLGYDFVWSDLVCYAAGVALGAAIDTLLARRRLTCPRGAA